MKQTWLIISFLFFISATCIRGQQNSVSEMTDDSEGERLTVKAQAPDSLPVPDDDVQAFFGENLQPILENRCMPCHFVGGKMYDKLPFDKAKTIQELGDQVFSRIKEPEEVKLFKDFLSAYPAEDVVN